MEPTLPSILSDRPDYSAELWELLAQQSRFYTSGDSSSVSEDTARDLLQSILFTLSAAPQSRPELSLKQLLKEGQDRLSARLLHARNLYEQVCQTAPGLKNIAYGDTVAQIGQFFPWYDLRCMAHQIPCSIDYQLAIPVSEQLQGVLFIEEYLRRLLVENLFFRAFDSRAAEGVLTVYCQDYKRLLINLFDPLFVNAAGLLLLGKDPQPLDITGTDQEILMALFHSPKREEAAAALKCVIPQQLCAELSLSQTDVGLEEYLAQCGEALAGRILSLTASAEGTFDSLFLSFPLQFRRL